MQENKCPYEQNIQHMLDFAEPINSEIQAHLLNCKSCAEDFKNYQTLFSSLKKKYKVEQYPDKNEKIDKIMQMISSHSVFKPAAKSDLFSWFNNYFKFALVLSAVVLFVVYSVPKKELQRGPEQTTEQFQITDSRLDIIFAKQAAPFDDKPEGIKKLKPDKQYKLGAAAVIALVNDSYSLTLADSAEFVLLKNTISLNSGHLHARIINTQKELVVSVPGASIKALGTAYTVSVYRDYSKINLKSGKIQIITDKLSIIHETGVVYVTAKGKISAEIPQKKQTIDNHYRPTRGEESSNYDAKGPVDLLDSF